MQQPINTLLIVLIAAVVAACGKADVDEPTANLEPVKLSTDAPAVTFKPENDAMGKPSGPITVSYRIIGKPVVGQPVAIDLRFISSMGDRPVKVAYRINDATAMRLGESQPAALSIAPAEDRGGSEQQVTVIPMREGRLYLNVSASVDTENGSISTVTAIPIQVGEAPRMFHENGTAGSDENGEAIRSLPAEET